MLEEIGIPELKQRQVETLCEVAEDAARRYILSRIPQKKIAMLDISVETEGLKPLTLSVDIEVALSPLMKNYDAAELVEEAKKEAFVSAEKYLRELACKSTR